MPKKSKSPKKTAIAEKPPMAAKVTALRNNLGLSQQKLADMLETHLSNVARIEAGKYKPSVEVVEKLMDIFGVTADELIRPQHKVTEKDRELHDLLVDLRKLDDKQRHIVLALVNAYKNKLHTKVLFAPVPIDEDALHGGKA